MSGKQHSCRRKCTQKDHSQAREAARTLRVMLRMIFKYNQENKAKFSKAIIAEQWRRESLSAKE